MHKFEFNKNPDGSYMSPDEIGRDIFQFRIKDHAILRMLQYNFKPPLTPLEQQMVSETGFDPNRMAQMQFGMWIRNAYGLWAEDNPYTAPPSGVGYIVENGVVTDPRHPDNVSAQIMEDLVWIVRTALEKALGEEPDGEWPGQEPEAAV